MDGADRQYGWYGGSRCAVIEHEYLGLRGYRGISEPPARSTQALVLGEGRVEHDSVYGELLDRRRKDEEALELEQLRGARMLSEQRRSRSDERSKRHDVTLPEMIDRRVGDLRETLAEIRRERTGATGKRRQGSVVAHGGGGLATGRRRRTEQESDVLAREAGRHLARDEAACRRRDRHARIERSGRGPEPARVRTPPSQPILDQAALLDPVSCRIDDQHLARAKPAAPDAGTLGESEGARLRGAGDEPVVGDGVAQRAQAVAVEGSSDDPPVREDDPGWAVPRLEEACVVAVEGANVLVELRVALPGLRHQHRHRVAHVPTSAHQQLGSVVQHRGV